MYFTQCTKNDGYLYCGAGGQGLTIVNLNLSDSNPSLIQTVEFVRVLLAIEHKLLAGVDNGDISVFDTSHKAKQDHPYQLIKIVRGGHSKRVTSLINYNNDKFTSASWDGNVKVWHLESGSCLKTLKIDNNFIDCLLLVFRKDKVISGDYAGNITIWSIEQEDANESNSNFMKSWKAHSQGVCQLLLNGENELISASIEIKITACDMKTYECICILEGHLKSITGLVICQEGQLISCSRDKKIKFWN